jgi:flagellin
MTRINTNINSLTAQQNLAKTSVLLQTALTRLSTGLRINSGKDDPAGMIAAAQLGSDIAGTNAAISNSQMAQKIIDTADAALGQINSLVNDIRTLVTQAANSAAMSPDQIAANQLQINSSLNAIDRISQSTNFQGRKLIDGSLDFTTTHNIDDTVSHYSAVQNLQIDTADSGTAATIPVTVSVSQQAQRAFLETSTPTTDPTVGTTNVTLSNGSFTITPPTGTAYDFTNMTVQFATTTGVHAASANYVTATKALTITVGDSGNNDLTALAAGLAVTTINGTGTTVNFGITNPSSAGVVFDPTKDSVSGNVAAVASNGYLRMESGGTIHMTAKTAGAAGNIHVALTDVTGTDTLTWAEEVKGVGNSPTIVVHVYTGTTGGVVQNSSTAIAAAITNGTNYTGTSVQSGNYTTGSTHDESVAAVATRAAIAGGTPLQLSLTARAPGLQGHAIATSVQIVDVGDNAPTVTYSTTTGGLTLVIDKQWTGHISDLLDAINNDPNATLIASSTNGAPTTTTIASLNLTVAGADSVATAADSQTVTSVTQTTGGSDALRGVTATLNTDTTGLAEDVQFMATGNAGSHLFTFEAGTALTLVRDAINQWSDGTGITATTRNDASTTYLTFASSDFGSAGTLAIDVRSGGATFKSNMKDRDDVNTVNSTGTDIEAKVNGVVATGVGNTLSIDTPALAMSMTVVDPTTAAPTPSTISFTITGGGAHFQIGPDVVSTQKAVIGIQSVDTANMNTAYGRLYELHSGEDAALTTDATKAGKIITAVAGKISTLRGRLGAFSKTTLETNINTLGSTVNALTNAQSQVQDADFAAETANLTRAQVLTQSGTAVLQIANRGPQNVLALLQNL